MYIDVDQRREVTLAGALVDEAVAGHAAHRADESGMVEAVARAQPHFDRLPDQHLIHVFRPDLRLQNKLDGPINLAISAEL